MLFEKESSLNLLDSAKARLDFTKVKEFITLAVSQPKIEQSFVFSFYLKPEGLPFSEANDEERDLQLQA